MKKRVLVIGSNSFIASNLIYHLKHECEVVGVYNSNKENLDNTIENISINNLNYLGPNFDQVFLLGAFISSNEMTEVDRQKMFAVNVQLVATVCKKFVKSKIIYSSTVSVYKPIGREIFELGDEGGINEYGLSKLWGEKIIQRSERFSIIRFSSVYGRDMKPNTIIKNYVKQALENNVITIWGNGTRMQDYIHVTDAVNFLINAGVIEDNGIFLGTSSKSISNLRLAEIIAEKTGCSLSFINIDKSPSFYYNNNFTVEKLGYKAAVSIEQGINDIIEWIKEKY